METNSQQQGLKGWWQRPVEGGEELFLPAVYRRSDAASAVGGGFAFAVACMWIDGCSVARCDNLVKSVIRKSGFDGSRKNN